ncbi:unnamed protein product [Danaus chrysippus]|uniref:(African queen) hypothetical protein n=1 Tax=Danaus chrysippus TaxID=151541 RepID=A0A8J2QD85_9NEOP|nr:unnamed protein product [Danaus chrysippus]
MTAFRPMSEKAGCPFPVPNLSLYFLIPNPPFSSTIELLSLLWNTCNYYRQFAPQVASHIKEKRAPIEKKLKDMFKICTWDRDLSYWSVKDVDVVDVVDKAHKALHKHTKEFEEYEYQLEQPCQLIQVNSLLAKIPSLLNKARTFCKDSIANTGYPALLHAWTTL